MWVWNRDALGCFQIRGEEVGQRIHRRSRPTRTPSNSFADEHRALSFVYVVRDGDQAVHFKHAGADTLELHNDATIKRASTTPTTDALINLPVSEAGA